MKKLLKWFSIVLILGTTLLKAYNLNNVLITAKTKKNIQNTPGSFSIITAKDISQMHATTLKDVLLQSIGISPTINGDASWGGRQNISIRGMKPKDTLILVDGEQVSGTDAQIGHSDFQYSWIPLDCIERIEIIRGPMSAIYGSQALGGVINIITKKSYKRVGDISISYGNDDAKGGIEKNISLNTSGKITKNIALTLGAVKKSVKQSYSKKDNNEPLLEGKELINFLLKGDIKLDDTQNISLSLIKGKEDRIFNLHKKYPFFRETYNNKEYELDREKYSLGYRKEFLNTTLETKYYTTISKNKFLVPIKTFTHNLRNSSFNIQFIIENLESNFITTGFEYKKDSYKRHYDKKSSSEFSKKDSSKAFFLQDEINLSDLFILTLGGRYDKYDIWGEEFSPKANIVYSLDENNKLKASYGHGFSAPTLTQSSSTYKVRNSIGNDNLKPETSNNFELGYEYYGNSNIFKSNIFYTKANKLISLEPLKSKKSTYQYININKASFRGLELEYTKNDILKNLDLITNYTYTKAEDEKSKKKIRYRPKQDLNMKLLYAFPYELKSNLHLNYIGSQRGDDKTLGGYTTYGVQFSKNINNNLVSILGVENLGNKILSDDDFNTRSRFIYAKLKYKF